MRRGKDTKDSREQQKTAPDGHKDQVGAEQGPAERTRQTREGLPTGGQGQSRVMLLRASRRVPLGGCAYAYCAPRPCGIESIWAPGTGDRSSNPLPPEMGATRGQASRACGRATFARIPLPRSEPDHSACSSPSRVHTKYGLGCNSHTVPRTTLSIKRQRGRRRPPIAPRNSAWARLRRRTRASVRQGVW